MADLNRDAVEALMSGLGIDSYAELARRAGLERSFVSRIMRGERPARPSHVVAFARALKVPVIALLAPDDAETALASLNGEPEAVA